MPAICTATVSPSNCSHRTHTIVWDGTTYTVRHHELTQSALTTAERQAFLEYSARILRFDKAVLAPNFLNRLLYGDEATNVKMYNFLGPGAAVTKTNIGTAYVNICPGVNGERQIVDFTGCTQFRLLLHANLIGTGAFGARVVRDSDNAVLIESANLGAAGERELDSDWTAIPAPFLGLGVVSMRVQAKSVTAADDPVFRSLQLGLR